MLCGAALLLAGCSTTTQGAPTVSSTEPAALFNPCDIPDDALRAAGVDPGTERVGLAEAGFEGWEICSWDASWYILGVFASDHTLDEVRRNTEWTRFEDAASGKRVGFTSANIGGESDTCNFAFATEQGVIIVNVVAKYLVPMPETPCSAALKRTSDLDADLPV